MRTILTSCLLVALAFCAPCRGQQRGPVPEDAEQTRGRERARELYAPLLEEAISSEEKARLAQQMIARGLDQEDDAAFAFGLFELAREVALMAGDEDTVLVAVRELTLAFRLDLAATRLGILDELRTRAKNPEQFRRYFEFAAESIDIARRRDDWEAAHRFLDLLEGLVPKTQDPGAKSRLKRLAENIEELEDGHAAYLEAAFDVQSGNARPDSYLIAGRYAAFLKGDWALGLGWLVQCKDEDIAAVAKAEFDHYEDSDHWLRIADLWFAVAQKETPGARPQIEDRTEAWYSAILGDLTGRERKRAEQRLTALFPAPSLPRDARPISFEADDWEVRCWIDREWKPFSLDKATARVRSGALELKNTTGIYGFIRLVYRPRFLEDDFLVAFDFRGQARELMIAPDNSLDMCIGTTVSEGGSKWRRAVFQRKAGTNRMWIDGVPQSLYTLAPTNQLPGFVGVSLESDLTLEIRKLHIVGGQER